MKSSQDFGDLVSMLKEKARADETAASAMATPRMPTDAGATMGKGEKQEQTNKQARSEGRNVLWSAIADRDGHRSETLSRGACGPI